MQFWDRQTLKSSLIPAGLLFVLAMIAIEGHLLHLSPSAVDFYYYSTFLAGFALTWRFQSSRMLFVLLTLLLADRAISFFSAGHLHYAGPGRIAFEAVALLLPVNFLVSAFSTEKGLNIPGILPRATLLFFESVFVAVICRPGQVAAPSFIRYSIPDHSHFAFTKMPQLALLAFIVAAILSIVFPVLRRTPMDACLPWSLAASFLALQRGGVGRIPEAYVATSALIVVTSIVEASYSLAYRDELTSLPGRRAFNDALHRMQPPYAIAAVDIDHFKAFNDSYGHDVGDQVLRLVASRLAAVTGGGRAFRVGGEEFSILFSGHSMKDAAPHLESLRVAIENSRFRLRAGEERRTTPRGPDRRASGRQNHNRRAVSYGRSSRDLAVTVSVGVAEPTTQSSQVEQVIEAADKALYRAKRGGRNRVELATARPKRATRLRRSIA